MLSFTADCPHAVDLDGRHFTWAQSLGGPMLKPDVRQWCAANIKGCWHMKTEKRDITFTEEGQLRLKAAAKITKQLGDNRPPEPIKKFFHMLMFEHKEDAVLFRMFWH